MEVCYEMFNGSIYFADDMKRVFYVSTGTDADFNYGAYIHWLNQLFGVSIKRYFKPTVESLLEHGYKVKAVWLYRKINGCTLLEAKDAIEEMLS